jgi:hypothetical protein
MTVVRQRAAVGLLVVLLAASAMLPGVRALVAPRDFYGSFPGFAHWVDRLPPWHAAGWSESFEHPGRLASG